jgi:hypothetical protein
LVKFATTAGLGPDRERDVGDNRARMGSISNLWRVFGLTLIFMLDASLQPADAGETKALRWLFAGRGAVAIASDADTSGLLEGARHFVVSSRLLREVPSGWQAIPLRSFKSFDEIRDAVEPTRWAPT